MDYNMAQDVLRGAGQALLTTGAVSAFFIAWKVIPIVYRNYRSPLRDIPGPPKASVITGNQMQLWKTSRDIKVEEWLDQYGPVLKYHGLLGVNMLLTTDLRATNYIISANMKNWHKPPEIAYQLARLLGRGVLLVEGDQHRRQRKIMNGAFGPAQIREITDIFVDKSNQLRDNITTEIGKQGGLANIDIIHWLSKATLDIIGAAGFSYSFDALDFDKPPSELNAAFKTVFKSAASFSLFPVLQWLIPPLRLIPTRRMQLVQDAKNKMDRIAAELVREKKEAIMREASEKVVGKESIASRDLLTLLLKANVASDVPDSQKLSDEEVMAQIPTFLGAGHETTSTSTTWALYALSADPAVQTRLREELLTLGTDNPTMDELNSLPYLDRVVREVLRIHAPVPNIIRVAQSDDVVPLSKPYVDKHGRVCENLRVRKGDTIVTSVLAINRSKELWGSDAHEFRPERWEKVPADVAAVPGIWSNMMTFMGGPHACIGYRFAIVEMKALLYALVVNFVWELAVPEEKILKNLGILVTRPFVEGEEAKGNSMPLLVKPYRRP